MNKLQPLQAYLVVKGFETKVFEMHAGRIITIQPCGKKFSYSQQFEGITYVCPLTYELDLDGEFRDALIENSVLLMENIITDSVYKDNICLRKEESEPMSTYSGLLEEGADQFKKIGFGDDSVPLIKDLEQELSEGTIEPVPADLTSYYQVALARVAPTESVEDLQKDGIEVLRIGGFLPRFGQVATVSNGSVELWEEKMVKEGEDLGPTRAVKIVKENAWQFIDITNLRTSLGRFRYSFKTEAEKPSINIFSEPNWYQQHQDKKGE